MSWTFIWLMLVLKIPIVGLGYIIWWAVKDPPEPETEPSNDDGGTKRRPHPRRPLPNTPRRGPHGDPAPLPPARTRPVVARGKPVKKD